MKKNAMDAGFVPMPAMKAPLGNGKRQAKLMRDDYCDGLGDCLPTSCPTISFIEEREAAAYDERGSETPPFQSKNFFQQKHSEHIACGIPASPMAGTDQTGTCQRPLL